MIFVANFDISGSSTSTGSFGTIRSDGLPLYVGDTKVGIGVTNPGNYNSVGNTLVVGNTAGNAGITIASSTSGYGALYFADSTSGTSEYDGAVEYNHSTRQMKFWAAANVSPPNIMLESNGDVTLGANISGSIASTGSFGAVITPTDGHIVGNMVEIIKVTVVDDGGNHFAFEGATTPNLVVSEGKTYRFDE